MRGNFSSRNNLLWLWSGDCLFYWQGSQILVSTSDQDGFEKAFDAKLDNNRVYIDGIISRKKQVIPNLTEVFDK